MKIFLFLIGIIAAGLVGYSFEPQMRLALTGKALDAKPKSEQVRKSIVVETGAPKKLIDPTTWPAEQLPKKVELKGDAEIANETGDIKMTITAGNRVDLVRLEGQTVIISPGPGPFQGSVPVSQTDLLDQLAGMEKMPVSPDPVPSDPTAVAANPAEETPATDPSEEVAVVEPAEVEGDSDPVEPTVAANDPEPADIPAVEDPAVEEEPPAAAGSSDVVSVMQSSIKAGDIKEFTFDQVLEWKANDEAETIDGETYQTGVASYKAETVFGVKTIQAKALVQDGKVVRWLWPKSGMEIK